MMFFNRKRMLAFALVVILFCCNISSVYAYQTERLVWENCENVSAKEEKIEASLSGNEIFIKESMEPVVSENDISSMEILTEENTYKTEESFNQGSISDNVILYSSKEEAENSFTLEKGFTTLQEALIEIDKIADSSNYYRILLNNSQEGNATFYHKGLVFPTKTKGIIIRKSSKIEEGNLYFKGNIVLKSNVKFEDIIFRYNGNSNLSLGKHTLELVNCYSNNNTEAVVFNAVTGNGTGKSSALYLKDTILKVNGVVNNLGKLCFQSEVEEELVASSIEEVRRIVPAYPEVIAGGKINIGKVILDTDAKITGIVKITRKNGNVTKITPDITINGRINSDKSKNLYIDLQEKIKNSCTLLDFSALEMEVWKLEKGISIVKSPCNNYANVYLFRYHQYPLIKMGGYYTYFNTGNETKENFYGVEVSFVEEGQKEIIYCHSFSDAVAEINQRKVKRDYTILLKKNVEDSSLNSPRNLKFPAKKYVNSLRIYAEETKPLKLSYTGNLALTCPVVIKNISFVQMVKVKGEYKEAALVKDDYPAAVSIKTGGYDLVFEGQVEFDTPVKIDGGKKGNLILRGTLNTNTNDFRAGEEKTKCVVYGMFTNVHTLSLRDRTLELREAKNSRTGKKYILSNNKITNLQLEDDAILKVSGVLNKNSLVVQELFLLNSEIEVEGSGKFKNVVLEGEQKAVIRVESVFQVTGKLEIKTDNGCLETRRKGKGKEPYLNISGKVLREEGRNPLYIGVFYEAGAGDFFQEEAVRLSDAPKATAQLLMAKNAAIENFRPIEENYPGGAFSSENTNGYVLVKKGAKIYVFSGEAYLQTNK